MPSKTAHEFIYDEIASIYDALVLDEYRHAHFNHLIRDFYASYVRIWFRANPFRGTTIKTTILFIDDIIEISHLDTPDGHSESLDLDLTHPNVWETLLSWMKEKNLVSGTAVLTGELSNDSSRDKQIA